ncbi:MAG: diguanylate cyclase [Spirochaetaceae bacterium]|jgi:diguanylate cyclase (GGDEF)-like protein|nr:diguanylate cyclase [Spirochaetaceae bacterium]
MNNKARACDEHSTSVVDKWLYYGFSREKVEVCRAAINEHNAIGLGVISIATACIIMLLSFYPSGLVHHNIVYYFFAIFQVLVFLYSTYLVKKNVKNKGAYVTGIMLFSLAIFSFALYICIIDQGLYTVRFLLFFFSLEIIFIFDALLALIYNVGILSLFALAYTYAEKLFGIEMAMESYYDVLNVAACCIIAMTMNWYISYVFIKGLITSQSLEKERNRYHEESIHDQLTSLNNRRSFEQSVNFYISVCRHVHQTVCVIMMDIDFFKNYNDHYGHHKGDVVLQTVGAVLKRLVDEERVYAARIGGEEFIVLWTENRTNEAERVALKLRQMIIDMHIPHAKSSVATCVTASLGLYIMRGGSQNDANELYNAADAALYKAKESGRNCVVRHDSADDSFKVVELRDHKEIGR